MGFDDVGFAKAQALEELKKPFNQWLEKDYHGQMTWLEDNLEKRLDPTLLVPGTKTIISLASYYYSDSYDADCGVSRYAVGRDYHKVLKKKGNELIAFIEKLVGNLNARAFVDSAPIMEREWATRAGIGWIGKNGCLIKPRKGSWLFLSEVFIDIDIPPDAPNQIDLCGSCTRCIQACPTDALLGNGFLDSNKCISYLTIELDGKLEKKSNPEWEKWIFGCDICQEVCPWNREPIQYQFIDFKPRKEVMELTSNLSKQVSEEILEESILGTPLKRAGLTGLIRNYNWIKPISH